MSFKDLGLSEETCKYIELLGWTEPKEIQQKAIPLALEGKDIIALAKTGSGKTGAFTIPIIEGLKKNPIPFYSVIFTPTRDLAKQIQNELKSLGGEMLHIKTCLLVGDMDEKHQAERIKSKPHVIIATTGRFLRHLRTTKGFNARQFESVKILVLDEADKMLSEDFEDDLGKVINVLPSTRQTLLYSATNTSDVKKLSKAKLKDPVTVSINDKFAPIETLSEYVFITKNDHDIENLVWFLKIINGLEKTDAKLAIFDELQLEKRPPIGKRRRTCIVFVDTIIKSNQITILLNNLGFRAKAMNGDMTHEQRTSSLNKMKDRSIDILVATNVIARGIDISNIDIVLNYGMCDSVKDYIHRIGRTARAGKKGIAILMICFADIGEFEEMQQKLGRELINLTPNDETYVIYRKEYMEIRQSVKNLYHEALNSLKKIQKLDKKRQVLNATDHIMKKKRRIE